MARRLHTHILPQAWALGQRQGFAPQGSHPTAQMMHGRDLKGEREEGGREEVSPDSLPSSPLPSALQTQYLYNVHWRRENTSCTCPRLDVCLGRDCPMVWPAPGTGPRLCPALSPPSSCCPQQDTTQSYPTGVPTQPGPPVCPKLAMEHQWPSSCRDNCGEPPLLRLIPPWCVDTPGRRRTHNAHAHTHKTNPKSGSVSERINYWLMHIQMRNSAEPGGALGGPAKENSSGEI